MSALEIYEVADRAWMGPEAVGTGCRDGHEGGIYVDGSTDPVLRRLRSAALLGALAWLALLPVPVDGGGMSGEVSRWSMLALLVVVPLGMALLAEARAASIGPVEGDLVDGDLLDAAEGAYRSGRDVPAGLGLLLPAVGGLASASLLMPAGLAAGLLALPWLGLAVGLTGREGRRFWAARPRDRGATGNAIRRETGQRAVDHGEAGPRDAKRISDMGSRLLGMDWWVEICVLIALLWWSVGAAWLLATRLAVDLGHGPLVARLTVAHFHYAGFGAAVLVVMAGRWIRRDSAEPATAIGTATSDEGSQRDRQRIARVALLMGTSAVLLAFPLVAAGIGLGPLADAGPGPSSGIAGILDPSWIGRLARSLELIGALGMGSGLLAIGTMQLWWIAPSLGSPAARWLMRLSGLGAVIAMPLAMGYGLRLAGLDIARMLSWHGRANALFFVLCGMLAWTLESRRAEG